MRKLLFILFLCCFSSFIVGCNDSKNSQYTISFNSNGGTEVSSIIQDFNTQVTKPDDPVKTGYTFAGWYSDSDLTKVFEFTTMPSDNITLYAKWTINQYTITLNSNGGTEVSSIIQDFNTQVTRPDDPVKTGNVFDGWYSDSDLTKVYEFTTMPSDNISLYAKWTINQYTITFNSNGGTEILSITQDYNTQVTRPDDPIKTGNIFDGWYSDSDLTTVYEFTTIPKENITLYAKWIEFSSEGLSYTPLGENTCSVSGYSGSNPDVLIPRVYDGCLVTRIGDNVFNGVTSLTRIIIPNSVTTMGMSVFQEATNLTTVIFEEGSQLTTIGYRAFYVASSLTSITIPNSVKVIQRLAFEGASSLTTVRFEEDSQLTTIGEHVFSSTSITSITIPKNVTKIGFGAFATSSLTSINVEVDNPEFISKDGVLLNKNQTLLISYPASKKGATYTIPDSVTEIGYSAFINAKNLTSITIPDSVTEITDDAFSRMSSLTSITIPNSVTSIGNHAFFLATGLTTVIFEEGSQLATIGAFAFEETTSLTNIKIPNSVKKIGNNAFIRSTNLTTVIFEEGSQLTTLGYAVFRSTSLTSIIITATTPPSIDTFINPDNSNLLGVLNSNLKIYVPSDYVDDYKEAWSCYDSIIYSISES